jgi:protein-L-isoaspartate(D-aspartate) O-methyltransferase
MAWTGTRDFTQARERMVRTQLEARGIRHAAVLDAMRRVPREAFVEPSQAEFAYDDEPLPIGLGQTISQPYIVAAMIEAVRPTASDRALEIGTGSGYSAAVLAALVSEVYTVERLQSLADEARRRLAALGYQNVHVRHGDGTLGWAEHAPYDVIIVTASGPRVPDALLAQLAAGGRLIMPVGPTLGAQRLVRVTRSADGRDAYEDREGVAFVPLIGAEAWQDPAPREGRRRP